MKKRFGLYALAWAIMFALFHVIAVICMGWRGEDAHMPSFWIGYASISAMFVGQLICAYAALKPRRPQELFYRVPLIRISYSGLVVTFIAGGACMLIKSLPWWGAVIVCAIVLARNVIRVIKALAVAEEVERIDNKVKYQTFFLKSLRTDAEAVLARAKSEEAKAVCKKVCDTVRYSDPMSSVQLASLEDEIATKFAGFSAAVSADDVSAIAAAGKELLLLLDDRNKKCKLLK